MLVQDCSALALEEEGGLLGNARMPSISWRWEGGSGTADELDEASNLRASTPAVEQQLESADHHITLKRDACSAVYHTSR